MYGNASVLPTPEDARPDPLNAYAESKVAAEAAVLAAGGDPVIVRPFTVYGPGQRPDMAFARWIRALEAGEPLPWHAPPGTARDFTYVDDVAAGIVAALRRGRAGRAYNLSGWRPVPLREALALLACGREPVLARAAVVDRRGVRDARLRPESRGRARLRAARRSWPKGSAASWRRAISSPACCLASSSSRWTVPVWFGILQPLLEDRYRLVGAPGQPQRLAEVEQRVRVVHVRGARRERLHRLLEHRDRPS